MAAPDKITLGQVAAAAGVSQAAASLAMRGKPGVGTDTRQRVQAVASELGYRAKIISDTGLSSLGLVVKTRPEDPGTTNAFYGPVIAGITEACKAAGIDLILDSMLVDDEFNPLEAPRLTTTREVEGLLVLGALLPAASVKVLAGFPLVLVDGYTKPDYDVSSVVIDNVGGAAAATERLIDAGHTRILMAGSTTTSYPSIAERRQGYQQVMDAHDLPQDFCDIGHQHFDLVGREVAERLTDNDGFTAVIASNDLVALAVHRELTKAGVAIGPDVSLIGFDDIDAARLVQPALDTVAVDKPAMGRMAVSLLIHRIAHPEDPAHTVVQSTTLVRRDSVGRI